MEVRHRRWIWILPLLLLSLLLTVLSCAPAQVGPRAWIDWPPQGFETSVGTTVTLIAHAYAEEGVAEIQLAVDRQAYRVVAPDQAGERFVELSADWLADEPGIYLLSVTTFDVNGQSSNPANVTVSVTGEGPQLIVTPGPGATAPPTIPTPEEPIATLVPTEAPPAPTATPLPPRIASFEVNRSQITAGECVRFSWRIDGSPTAIYFDGDGVSSPDSRERCPTGTRDFELRAEGPSGVDAQSITVVVIEPSPVPDTQGPPAPSLISPTGNAEQACGAVTLRWSGVTDPSGIKTYYVKVEKVTETFKSGAWTTANTQFTIPAVWLECGQAYEWAVRAEDGAGNLGPWSSWGSFSVTLG